MSVYFGKGAGANVKQKRLDRFFKQEKIYILPTKQGLVFFGLLILLFVISFSYGNNLVFLSFSLLLSFWILKMIGAHFLLKNFNFRLPLRLEGFSSALDWNSNGFKVYSLASQPVKKYKSEAADLRVEWSWHYEIETEKVGFIKGQLLLGPDGELSNFKFSDLPGRGHYSLKWLRLETKEVLGLFKAFCFFKTPGHELVLWPEPVPFSGDGLDKIEARTSRVSPLSPMAFSDQGEQGDFKGVREFIRGDRQAHVLWQLRLKNKQSVYVKDFHREPQNPKETLACLDFYKVYESAQNFELAISQYFTILYDFYLKKKPILIRDPLIHAPQGFVDLGNSDLRWLLSSEQEYKNYFNHSLAKARSQDWVKGF